jgi:quinol-cytochrome oxidoreductase complex cytochrome b subunit
MGNLLWQFVLYHLVLQGIHYLGIKLVTGLLKNCNRSSDAIPVIGPTVVELLRGGVGVG